MIPLRDHNPARTRPYVTIALIAMNIALFFTEPLTAGDARQSLYFICHAVVPYEVTHGETLSKALDDGDLSQASTQDARIRRAFASAQRNGIIDETGAEVDGCPEKNVWLSIFKAMFLHGGFLHIAGNMLFLWVFGNNIEDRLGRVRFLLFYLLSGIAATYAQSFLEPSSAIPMLGASGAVAGVLGAYLLLFPRARVTNLLFLGFFITTIELPAVLVLGFWFVLQLFQGFGSVTGSAGGVAYAAHVGGFVAGMLLLLVFRPRRDSVSAPPPF